MAKTRFQGFNGSTFTVSKKGTVKRKKPTLGNKVTALAKTVHKLEPSKNHYFQYSGTVFVPDDGGSNGAITLSALVAQGNTAFTRIGDRITMKSLKYRVYCTLPLNVAPDNYYNMLRMIILIDKDNVFNNAAQLLTNTVDTSQADYIPSEKPRWTKLVDKLMPWPASTNQLTGSTLTPTMTVGGTIKLRDVQCYYQPGSTNNYKNALKVYFLTNQAAGTGQITAQLSATLWFDNVI